MCIGRTLVQREYGKLVALDPADRNRLLAVGRKLDGLIVQYYWEKLLGSKRAANGSCADT